MKEYTKQHKKAWEYNAYDFWVKNSGTPAERAKEDAADPEKISPKRTNAMPWKQRRQQMFL